MDMNAKKKFLIIGLLVVVALSVFVGHFWSYTACALGKAVADGLLVLLFFAKFLAGVTGVHFLL
jgi:hypothetical protein